MAYPTTISADLVKLTRTGLTSFKAMLTRIRLAEPSIAMARYTSHVLPSTSPENSLGVSWLIIPMNRLNNREVTDMWNVIRMDELDVLF